MSPNGEKGGGRDPTTVMKTRESCGIQKGKAWGLRSSSQKLGRRQKEGGEILTAGGYDQNSGTILE